MSADITSIKSHRDFLSGPPCVHVNASLTLVSTVIQVPRGFVGALTIGSSALERASYGNSMRLKKRRHENENTRGPLHRWSFVNTSMKCTFTWMSRNGVTTALVIPQMSTM